MISREHLPFLLACLALILSFLLLIAFHAGSASSDVAAWVQAIGSIVAIVGAIYAIHFQHRLEAKRTREATNAEWNTNLQVLIELTERAKRDVTTMLFFFDDVKMRETYMLRGFDRALSQCNLEALETFPIDCLSNAQLRIQLLYSRFVVRRFLEVADDLIAAASGRGVIYSVGAKDRLQAFQTRLDFVIAEYRLALRH